MADPFNWGELLTKAQGARGRSGLANPELISRLLVAKENNDVGSIEDILSNNAYNSRMYGGDGSANAGLFLRNKGYIDPNDYSQAKVAPPRNDVDDIYDKYRAPGFIDTLIPQSNLDIGSILSQQASKFRSTLDAGRQRGTYSPTAYNAGIEELNKQFSAARPLAQDLISGIYQEPRSGIENLLSEAGMAKERDKDKFNFDPFKEKIDRIAADFGPTANERATNALSGSSFFTMPNINSAVAGAGTSANASNPALLQALMEQRQRQGTTRGLGNQGGL